MSETFARKGSFNWQFQGKLNVNIFIQERKFIGNSLQETFIDLEENSHFSNYNTEVSSFISKSSIMLISLYKVISLIFK